MKTLLIIPVLAILLATGCTTLGSKGNTVDTTGPVTAGTELTTEAPVTVTIPTKARIDATSFLNALVMSGCEIDKAEYKEVTRGGGITVTCTKRVGVLDAEGLDGL